MRKNLKTIIIFIFLLLIIPISSFASTLTLKITTDQSNYKVEDKVIATVNWNENMQAASFKLTYDSQKLKFKSASISNTFYNESVAGEISVNWASMEEKDLSKISFEFIAKEIGNANIQIKEADAFADGNMVSPTDYNISSGNVNISIEQKSSNINDNSNGTEKKIENTVKAYSTKEVETQNSKKLPNTGIQTIIVPAIIICTIGGVVVYLKYRKLYGI